MTNLTPEEIRNTIKHATLGGKLAMLKMSTCPVDVLEAYAFSSLAVASRDQIAQQRLRRIARKNRKISAEAITSYFQAASRSQVDFQVLGAFNEFFDNPNFSEQIFIKALNSHNHPTRKDPRKIAAAERAKEKLLTLAVSYKGTSTALLKEASKHHKLYTLIAKHPSLSDSIARKIVNSSYLDTQLSHKGMEALVNKRRENMFFSPYQDSWLTRLQEIHRTITLAVARNPKTSVEMLIELIPSQQILESKPKGLPDLLRALLRSLPAGQERNRVAEMLLGLKKGAKIDPTSRKLLAHSITDPELLKNIIYGKDKALSRLAATNSLANEEDKVFVALSTGQGLPEKPRLKTRFGV